MRRRKTTTQRKNLIIPILIVIALAVIAFILFQPKLDELMGIAPAASPTPSPTETTPTPQQTEIGWQTPKSKFYAPILLYHHIAEVSPQQSYYVSPEIFDEQMQWLRDHGYTIISFDEFFKAAEGKGKLPPKPVILTFDDGNKDNYTNALPILKKYGYTATFFIKLNNLGKGGLTLDNLREIIAAGNIIGSHSVNHDNMANMDPATLAHELTYSKKYLEQNLGIEVKYFSYPGGAYSTKTIQAARSAGYLAAVTTRHEAYQNIKNSNALYTLPRIHIDDEMPTFIDWVQGKNLH